MFDGDWVWRGRRSLPVGIGIQGGFVLQSSSRIYSLHTKPLADARASFRFLPEEGVAIPNDVGLTQHVQWNLEKSECCIARFDTEAYAG